MRIRHRSLSLHFELHVELKLVLSTFIKLTSVSNFDTAVGSLLRKCWSHFCLWSKYFSWFFLTRSMSHIIGNVSQKEIVFGWHYRPSGIKQYKPFCWGPEPLVRMCAYRLSAVQWCSICFNFVYVALSNCTVPRFTALDSLSCCIIFQVMSWANRIERDFEKAKQL